MISFSQGMLIFLFLCCRLFLLFERNFKPAILYRKGDTLQTYSGIVQITCLGARLSLMLIGQWQFFILFHNQKITGFLCALCVCVCVCVCVWNQIFRLLSLVALFLTRKHVQLNRKKTWSTILNSSLVGIALLLPPLFARSYNTRAMNHHFCVLRSRKTAD